MNLGERHIAELCKFRIARCLAVMCLQITLLDSAKLVIRLGHMNRDSDRRAIIRHSARNRLLHPPGCIGGELVTAAIFKLIDRLHETEIAFLNKVSHGKTAVHIGFGDRNHESEVRFDHLALRRRQVALSDLHGLGKLTLLGNGDAGGLFFIPKLFLHSHQHRFLALNTL